MRIILTLLFSLWLITLSSCKEERPTAVQVLAGPSFRLVGSGRLASFTVYAPQTGQRIAFPQPDVSIPIWRIEASSGFFRGNRVQGLQVSYGEVPREYRQVVPGQTQPAPALASGNVYSFFAESTDAPVEDGYFYMDGNEPIQVTIPDLCLMLVDGRQVRVNCSTKKPYKEPLNIEEIVRQNRIGPRSGIPNR